MTQWNFWQDEPKKTITKEEVNDIVQKTFPNLIRNIFYLDRKYVVLSERELGLKLQKAGINLNKYIPEEYDCDDFAIALMDNLHEYAVGFVVVAKEDNTFHAVNIQIDADNKIAKLIDPQTNLEFKEQIKYIYLALI